MESVTLNSDQNSGCQVGVNNGVMNFTSKQPEPRPEPLWIVPFQHDPDFVPREEILKTIHEKSSVPGSRIVLVGIGGVGKTRLAIEYCHQVREESSDTWVFWVHASTAARCEQSLRNLADRAKVPGHEDQNVNIFQLVGNWLQDGNIGKWILVLDNVDDDELLRTPLTTRTDARANARSHVSTQPPLKYLLEASNGFIIITSRNKAVASEIVGPKKHLIDVQPMDTAEALDLMQHKLDSDADRSDLVQLVEELEFMPLALVQAASYIAHSSPRCSVSQYLEKLRQSDRQATELLNFEAFHTERDWEAKDSIILTWQISFDHIRRIRPSAADLLSLMSFFDSQGIPEDLLRNRGLERNHDTLVSSGKVTNSLGEEDSDTSSESDLGDSFESDIATLRDYSFISISENSMVLTMHRLVQLTVRTWFKTHGQAEEWKKQFIYNLYNGFPTAEYENWERCRTLFPHVKSAMSHRPKSQDCLQSWADLLYMAAWYAHQCGNILDSREMASVSREQRIKILGLEDEDTLHSTTMLAMTYRLEGAWREAEHLHVQVMETLKAKLGADHPDTLTSMASLAPTYIEQGRWEEAEQLLVQVIEARKTKLGADHPDTLASMANLASTYVEQGRWKEAEQLFVQVMETRKTKLGADHPDTLASMASLAPTYVEQGRLEEAEKLLVQVIETRKTTLGANHLDTLMSMADLASTYTRQGRWEEAEQLQVQVIETRKTKLGIDHPDTLSSINDLASTYIKQGRWKGAEQLSLQVIETSKMKLEADHPDTLASIANLASTYVEQGRWKEAEQLDVQVMETRKTKLGADHPDTLTSIANLASTIWKQGRWKEAEQLLVQVIEARKTKLGADHPDTLASMANLGSTYVEQDRCEEAEQLFVLVMETSKTKLGADHPDTLTITANLASTYRKQGRLEEAEQLQVQVMEMRKTKLGDNHPDTLASMNNLAHTIWSAGQDQAALLLMAECARMSEQKLGPDHPHTTYSKSTLEKWSDRNFSTSSSPQPTEAETESKSVQEIGRF
ncbi:hypothetical protein N7462_008362 [Penicillium macrosclerotiorum]|uniref:uncharacterized protein n=1 Tax=Penicillium macrosclerotiorum TaxID=303699 RepID=UPI002546D19E|nr:uncharacterized protein N7462_008362 [Penicillium macrosclerotiorum]KAJ5675465.1 hypothetical protein N7462_008362 [Penicillium macrosclerotiorum]